MLVVGAGVIGQAVARRAVEDGREVTVLVRHERPELDGLRQVVGDAREPALGLPGPVADELRARTSHVVIAAGRAAPVSEMTLGEAYDQHVVPTIGALDFAASCRDLEAVAFLSSAVVVADTPGPVRSDRLPAREPHRSSYAWAKHETEALVRRSGLDCRVVRAGHVVDDRVDVTGRRDPEIAAALRRLLARPALPIDPAARYWAAPATLVADVVVAMCRTAGPGSCWAVDPAAPTFGEVLDALAVRHQFRTWRLPGRRALRTLARAGGDLRSTDYVLAEFDLDLRCLERLAETVPLRFPVDRSYLVSAFDRELGRLSELAT